jgi:hypothetical protein
MVRAAAHSIRARPYQWKEKWLVDSSWCTVHPVLAHSIPSGVGRPLYWGLAVSGAEGVHGMLEVLRHELDQVLDYCGQIDVQHPEPRLVTVPHGWGNGTMYA